MSGVYGVAMVKDEADIIAGTLRHLSDEGLDGIIVADNGSTDGTRDILEDLKDDLTAELIIVDDPDPGYYQSRKVSVLADLARMRGAKWVIPFDADELWLAPHRIVDVLEAIPPGYSIAAAQLYNHFPSGIDPTDPDPFRSIQWRQAEPAGLPKVAFRPAEGAVVHQGNHGVTLNGPARITVALEVRHFPYRSAEQFVRKARNGAAAYAATDLPEDAGAHWRGYGTILERYGEEALAEVWREHFWFLAPFESGLIHDPAPYLRWRQ